MPEMEGDGWRLEERIPEDIEDGTYKLARMPEGTWAFEPGLYFVSQGSYRAVLVVDETVETGQIWKAVDEL